MRKRIGYILLCCLLLLTTVLSTSCAGIGALIDGIPANRGGTGGQTTTAGAKGTAAPVVTTEGAPATTVPGTTVTEPEPTGNEEPDIKTDYITREELQRIIGELRSEIVPSETEEVLSAGNALLSVVSIYCQHNVTYTVDYWYSRRTETKTVSSAGSGVIYKLDKESGDAYIITNYHVVYYYMSDTENHISDDIKLYLYGQENEKYAIPATYIGGSMNYDLAVLKVSGSDVLKNSNAVAVTVADSDRVEVLDTAIAIGNPEAKGISATVGHINVDSESLSLLGADESTPVTLRVMRIDTAVNSGNSGGGLFNSRGELIGIVNAKMSTSVADNIGYAIPSNVARYVADNVIYYCNGTENEGVYRFLLGITLTAAEQYTVTDVVTGGVRKMETVEVAAVEAGGLADGKLRVGDRIESVTIDGVTTQINRIHTLTDLMFTVRENSAVTITCLRDGARVSVPFSLAGANLTEQ